MYARADKCGLDPGTTTVLKILRARIAAVLMKRNGYELRLNEFILREDGGPPQR